MSNELTEQNSVAPRKRHILRWVVIISASLFILGIIVLFGLLKFVDARIFSNMTPKEKDIFQHWYTEKVAIPPDALKVKEYAPDTIKAVDECNAQYENLKDKIENLEKEYANTFSSKNSETLQPGNFVNRWEIRFREVEPLLAAYRTIVRQPDYDTEVWRPMPGKWKPTEKSSSPVMGNIQGCTQLRIMAHLTAMQAVMELEKNNFSEAMKCADTIILSARAHPYSTLIDQMVAVAVFHIGTQTWQRLINQFQSNPELLRATREMLSTHNLDTYHFDLPTGNFLYSSDQIALIRHARRWGVESNVLDKNNGPAIMWEASRVQLEVDKKYSNNIGLTPVEVDARLQAQQNQINTYTGKGGFAKNLVMRLTGRQQVGILFNISMPGLKKAQEQAQKNQQEYRDLLKSLDKKLGVTK
ncbi:TPA: hypothetical protein DDW35_06675 [Candidatus Sumerlaeota bacterium]|jgi:hypothetical protein|nr:hypothetical protein [Candidatus Sumerlaeota bacterium]